MGELSEKILRANEAAWRDRAKRAEADLAQANTTIAELRAKHEQACAEAVGLTAALKAVATLLEAHQRAWEHQLEDDLEDSLDDPCANHDDDCRACEYETLLERCRAALDALPCPTAPATGERPTCTCGTPTLVHDVACPDAAPSGGAPGGEAGVCATCGHAMHREMCLVPLSDYVCACSTGRAASGGGR